MRKGTTIWVDIKDETLKKIKIYCIKNDISFKDFATKALEDKAIKLGIIKKTI